MEKQAATEAPASSVTHKRVESDGEIAYNAHRESNGRCSFMSMTHWVNLDYDQKLAWDAAARAVRDSIQESKRSPKNGVIEDTWISVEKQLPTHIYSVAIHVVGGPLCFVSGEEYDDVGAYFPEEKVWKAYSEQLGDDQVVQVSHWMQLSDVPK